METDFIETLSVFGSSTFTVHVALRNEEGTVAVIMALPIFLGSTLIFFPLPLSMTTGFVSSCWTVHRRLL